MPVTLGVVGLGTAAVKTAADFDSAMCKVAAVSGATGSDLEALRDKAREMGEKTKFSTSEAAEAMNYMAMAGWKTEDMLSGIEGVMNLAAASGEDLATTSDITVLRGNILRRGTGIRRNQTGAYNKGVPKTGAPFLNLGRRLCKWNI